MGSVAAQSVPVLETIVVDDGSTDETAALAAELGARVLRLSHAGVSAARNQGLAQASGELVLFLDADDELEPDAVASAVSEFEAHPEAWMVARCCVLTNDDGEKLPTNCAVPDGGDPYPEWLGRNLVWTPGAAVFRREPMLRIGGFPEGVGPAADYAVYLEMARSGRVVFDPRVVVRYRQHDTNMSLDPVRMLRATLGVLALEQPKVPPEHRRAFAEGRRSWCTFYGELIIQQLRRDLRERRFGRAQLSAAVLLARECLPLAFTHLWRKGRRVLAGHPPSTIEPGRFQRSAGSDERPAAPIELPR